MNYDGLDDQVTRHTARGNNFRDEVIQRDGSCLITRAPAEMCDAAHLILRSKGNEVSL